MSDIVVNITPPAPITLAYTQGGAVGPQGPAGSTGGVGPTNRLVIGAVTSGTAASATISAQTVANGTATQTINLVLPQGATGSQGIQGNVGPAGPANVLSVGTVATTSATTASISITGTAPSQVISFVVPRGPQGEAGPYTVVKVGGVTTGAAGTNAKVDAVSAGGTVTLSFTIPRGADATANLADETPQPLGVASAGSALAAARADHIHATLTSFPYSSLTGVPTSFVPSSHTQTISTVVGLQDALDGKQAAGNYAPLVNNLVPSANLPSYVDDVIDVGGTLPASGDVGKIYVVSTGANTNKIYRWSGSTFVEISPSPGSTDGIAEGSTNLYYTDARAAAAAPVQKVAGRTGTITLTKSDVGLGNVPNTDATARANHTGTQIASTISDFATEAAKYGPVTSVASRTGDVTITVDDVAGLAVLLEGLSSDVDGGDYVGAVVTPSITITSQPVSYAASLETGSTWTQTGYGNSYWRAVAYNGSRWVIAGTQFNNPSGYYTSTSTDAVNWTTRGNQNSPRGAVYGLATDGTAFVGVGNTSYAKSTDGLTWSSGSLPSDAFALCYGNSRYMAVGTSSTFSTNGGTSWSTPVTLPATCSAVAYGSSGFVALPSASSSSAYLSAAGASWSAVTLPSSTVWSSIASSGSAYVAIRSGSSSSAAYSANGTSWSNVNLPASRSWRGASYVAGKFWAFAANYAAYSSDGQNWSSATLPAVSTWVGAAGGSSSVLAVSTGTAPHIYSVGSSSATFSVSAVSTASLGYQWQLSTDGGATFSNISGATSAMLSLSSLTTGDSGKKYRCVVSATGTSSVTSDPATLTVT